MPYFDGANGRVDFRRWRPGRTETVTVFLHGCGQQSSFSHRLDSVLNHANIEPDTNPLADRGDSYFRIAEQVARGTSQNPEA